MRVLILASHYQAEHAAALRPYRGLNPAASSWNTALLSALGHLDLDIDLVQFWPVRGYHSIQEGRVTHHYLPRLPGVDGFTSIVKRWRVAALVRRFKPDLIHGIGSEHGHAWAAIGHGIPALITIHGWLKVIYALPGHGTPLRRIGLVREEARALRRADGVIAINDYMRARLVAEGGCDEARVYVVPNALNPVFLGDWQEAARPIDLIVVGTLHALKNQHVALRLLARLQRLHGLKPRVVVVGAATAQSQSYARGLQILRNELDLSHVELVGKKSPAQLFALYGQSRFLLHLSSFETDSVVVAEALACGTLPVVNPVAGLAHRVQHGANGWHLKVDALDAAADQLCSYLGDEAQRVAMARTGRRDILAQRQPHAVAQATLGVYQQLLATPSNPVSEV